MTRNARELALLQLGASLPILERAYRATANQAMAGLGVSQAMAWPLVMIGRQGDGLRQGVLADLVGIEGPSLTRTLDQLVEAGFVERREDPEDRRAKTLYLTDAGSAACEQIETILRDLRNEVYEGVTDADIEATLRVFTALQQRLGCPSPIVPPRAAKRMPQRP
jgi:MarR family transcriptional regulator, transcriptional regulator for hemolysin